MNTLILAGGQFTYDQGRAVGLEASEGAEDGAERRGDEVRGFVGDGGPGDLAEAVEPATVCGREGVDRCDDDIFVVGGATVSLLNSDGEGGVGTANRLGRLVEQLRAMVEQQERRADPVRQLRENDGLVGAGGQDDELSPGVVRQTIGNGVERIGRGEDCHASSSGRRT